MREDRDKAETWEGQDIMFYLEREMRGIKDDELTKNRIRSIYSRINYGDASPCELAEYYDIPSKVIRGIGSGELFGEITKDLQKGDE